MPATAAPRRPITTSTSGSGTEPPPWSGASAVGSTASDAVSDGVLDGSSGPVGAADSDAESVAEASGVAAVSLGSTGVEPVADGVAEPGTPAVGDASSVEVGRGPPVPSAVGVAVAAVVAVLVGVFVGLSLGVGVAEGLPGPDGVGLAVGLGDGDGDGEPACDGADTPGGPWDAPCQAKATDPPAGTVSEPTPRLE